MRTKSIILIAIALVFLTSSSSCINSGKGITGSNNYITRDFKVGSFDKLNIKGIADIYYTQSTDGSTSFQVYGPDNIVELVKVNIKDNTLVVSMKKKNQHIKRSNLRMEISSPTLQHVDINGVGNFYIKGKMEATNLTIENELVGNLRIDDIRCAELELRIKGVGSNSIQGEVDKVTLISQGIGNIDAADLVSRDVIAKSEGVGDISCYATESIDATINGVGNISYRGNPAKKEITKNGPGSIKQK